MFEDKKEVVEKDVKKDDVEAKKPKKPAKAKAEPKAEKPLGSVVKVTNHHDGPLCLSKGPTIGPGRSAKIANWDFVSKNRVVKAWLAAGVISVEDAG